MDKNSSNGYKILTVEEILALDDLPVEIVPVPEWGKGAAVKVRGMTVEERLRYTKESKGENGKVDLEKATILSITIGVVEPKFGPEHAQALTKKSAAALDRISKVWLRLSGIGDKELVEARGNS